MTDLNHVLIVEDDVMTAELYIKLLTQANYKVYHAIDTESAESILQSESIDLLVLDYDLPDHIGLHWLRDMRQYDDFAKLPAILISYLPRNDDITQDQNVWFMQKPRLPQQIVAAVENTIAQFKE